MTRLNPFFVISFASLVLLLSACSNSPESDTSENVMSSTDETLPALQLTQQVLIGHWLIEKAWRDGQPAASLDDAFFDFGDDGIMVTNIFGGIEEHEYTLEEQRIYQKGVQPITYTVEEHQDSSLVMSMSMRGVAFKFALRKDSDF